MSSSMSLREMFERLQQLDSSQREAWLEQPDISPTQRAQLRRMLAQQPNVGLLERNAAEEAHALLSREGDTPGERWLGRMVGPYRLIELIGQGGMATVFRAERPLDDATQTVAIKLLHMGLFSELSRSYFSRERRALAQLEHPNIARLIDGGTSDTDIPYLVMEYVQGQPLTEYCLRHACDSRQRLRLLQTTCRAVEAAHRALIVHRDIKPANVLVAQSGDIKLLDFGIAKLLDDEHATSTQTGMRAMTPAYAAPEQLAGETVTTATDVYALGLLLHELLLGTLPTRPVLRAPSETVLPDGALGLGRTQLKRLLRGDLDNILQKALAHEPERRYGNAGALADDIERHLQGQPVLAHPPSRWYRTRKFVGRNRLSVALSSGLILGLIASLSLALQQAREARHQSAIALSAEAQSRAELAHATSLRDFLETLFDPVRIGGAVDKAPTVRELVLAGETQLRENTRLAVAARVEMLSFFALLHESIGELSSARRLATESVALAENTLSSEDPRYAAALAMRGYTAVRMEDYLAAEADLRIALPLMKKSGQRGWPLANAMQAMSSIESINGHVEKSLEYAKDDLVERIFAFGASDRRVGVGYNNVADALEAVGQYRQSIVAYENAYRIQLARLGPDNAETTNTLSGLASSYWRAGQWQHARSLFQQVTDRFDRFGRKAQLVELYPVVKLCMLELWLVNAVEAERVCAKARRMTAASIGRNSESWGDIERAEFEGALERGDLPKAHDAYLRADALYPASVANRLRRGLLQSSYAEWLIRQGRLDEARKLLPEAISDIEARPHKMPLLLAQARLLFVCDRSPGSECSIGLRDDYEATLSAVADLDHPQTLIAETLIAKVDLPIDGSKAIARLRAVITTSEVELGRNHPRVLAAREVLESSREQAE